MNAMEWLQILALGGVAGMVGQGVRMIVGIKQLHDQAAAAGVPPKELLDLPQLTLEMVVGFIAGSLAAMVTSLDPNNIDSRHLLGLLAAGYAGTDFIQGLMARATSALPTAASGSDSAPAAAAKPLAPLS